MHTITGLFDTYQHASEAVHALHKADIRHADISVVANKADGWDDKPDIIGKDATAGAEIGAGIGAAGGLLAGLGLIAIPGLGAVFAGGWLVATVMGALAGAGIGAAAGGLVGVLTQAGIPEADANVYAEAIRRGGTLVTARVDDSHAEAAAAILRGPNSVDVAGRRRDYEEEGWERFDEDAKPVNPDGTWPRLPIIPPML